MQRKECNSKVANKDSHTRKQNSRKSSPHGASMLLVFSTCQFLQGQLLLKTGIHANIRARLFNNGNAGAAPVMAQYLKASTNPKYTVAQINVYPTGTSAIQVVTTFIYAWSSDSFLKGRRWPPIVFGGVSEQFLF